MFEKASKLKLRFTTAIGNLTVEDLWDLPLTKESSPTRDYVSLDDIARSASRDLKASEEESFVVKKTRDNKIQQLRMDIVKHVIEVKLANIEKAEKSAITKEKKAKILAMLANKEDEALAGKSTEELQELLDDL